MATIEQALSVLDKLKENRPAKFFNKVDETAAGMRFVLIFLSENKDVYASTIADKMKISRARVGILIQKLLNKGLIEKSASKQDGRIDVLGLTPLGIAEMKKFHENTLSNLIKVIDEVGLDEINKFIEISAKIKNILEEVE